MKTFTTEKTFDGFSTCFRQWKAEGTHCKFLHGYGVSFKVTFTGLLNAQNWVYDFGGMKRSKTLINGLQPADYFKWLLDHTVIVAENDPELKVFEVLQESGIIQLRTLPDVGCEKFAEHLYNVINNFLNIETGGRVKVIKVEFKEHSKNSASYSETT